MFEPVKDDLRAFHRPDRRFSEAMLRQLDCRLAVPALGIWVGAIGSLVTGPVLGIYASVGSAVLAGISHWLARGFNTRNIVCGVLFALIAGLALGSWLMSMVLLVRDSSPLPTWVEERRHVVVDAVVADDPKRIAHRRDLYLVVVEIDRVYSRHVSIDTPGKLVLFGDREVSKWASLLPGEKVRVTGVLAPSERFGVEIGVMSVRKAPVSVSDPPWWQIEAGDLREGLRSACSFLPDDVAGLLPGLAIGDTSEMTADVEEDFRDAGMTHLLAVSGSNVAIVVGAALLLMRAIGVPLKLRWVFAIAVVVGFVVLVRPSPSVLRAALMGVIGLVAVGTERSRAVIPVLSATVIGLLCWDPGLAVDIGFALSVLATVGIVVFASPWSDAMMSHGVPQWLALSVAVPSSATVMVTPLTTAMSGKIDLVSVPANMLVSIAVAPAAVLGVIATVTAAVSLELAELVVWLASWPARWMVVVADLSSGFVSVPWPTGLGPTLLLVLVLVGIVGLMYFRRGRRFLAILLLGVVVGVTPVVWWFPGWPPDRWVMVACDVGQGDAAVLSTGRPGEAVVIDAGPDPTVVDDCLDDLEIEHVPLLVLTHFHADHVSGVPGIMSDRQVGTVLASVDSMEESTVARDTGRLLESGRIVLPVAGERWSVGKLELTVIAAGGLVDEVSPNNESVVILARIYGVTVLLTGDLEEDAQRALMATGVDISADVLKVPHHGSRGTAAEFLDEVAPRVAIVSVGLGNKYGHPHRSVVERLERNGAMVRRTDRDGSIAVAATSNGGIAVMLGGGH